MADEQFFCKVCSQRFTSKWKLGRHIKYEHKSDVKLYECPMCKKWGKKGRQQIQNHLTVVHGVSEQRARCMEIQCCKCDLTEMECMPLLDEVSMDDPPAKKAALKDHSTCSKNCVTKDDSHKNSDSTQCRAKSIRKKFKREADSENEAPPAKKRKTDNSRSIAKELSNIKAENLKLYECSICEKWGEKDTVQSHMKRRHDLEASNICDLETCVCTDTELMCMPMLTDDVEDYFDNFFNLFDETHSEVREVIKSNSKDSFEQKRKELLKSEAKSGSKLTNTLLPNKSGENKPQVVINKKHNSKGKKETEELFLNKSRAQVSDSNHAPKGSKSEELFQRKSAETKPQMSEMRSDSKRSEDKLQKDDKVSCTNAGCPDRVDSKILQNHVESCKYKPLKCVYCKEMVPRKDLQDKSHSAICKDWKVTCLQCGRQVLKQELEIHIQLNHTKKKKVPTATLR